MPVLPHFGQRSFSYQSLVIATAASSFFQVLIRARRVRWKEITVGIVGGTETGRLVECVDALRAGRQFQDLNESVEGLLMTRCRYAKLIGSNR